MPRRGGVPGLSATAPLRTLLLDPAVNDIPRSRVQSELRRTLRAADRPHASYDVDGDGAISPGDIAVARRCDAGGTGVLGKAQRAEARRILAEDFFLQHRGDYNLYGEKWTGDPAADARSLAADPTFAFSLGQLRTKEMRLFNCGSQKMTGCLSVPARLTTTNFFTDKFDTTAWNDVGAVPRTVKTLAHHHGSRELLFQSRNIKARDACQHKLESAHQPRFSTRRTACITNWAVENG